MIRLFNSRGDHIGFTDAPYLRWGINDVPYCNEVRLRPVGSWCEPVSGDEPVMVEVFKISCLVRSGYGEYSHILTSYPDDIWDKPHFYSLAKRSFDV